MCADFDYTQRHSSFILQFFYYFFPTPNYLNRNLKLSQLLNHPLLLSTQAPFHGLLSLLLLPKLLSDSLLEKSLRPILLQIQLQSNTPFLHRFLPQTEPRPGIFFSSLRTVSLAFFSGVSQQNQLLRSNKKLLLHKTANNPFQLESFECEIYYSWLNWHCSQPVSSHQTKSVL